MRVVWHQRASGYMTPEQLLVTALHDAFVRVTPFCIHDRNDPRPGALELIRRRVQYEKRFSDQSLAFVAEHFGQRVIAGMDHTMLRDAHADRRMLEYRFVIYCL